MTARTEYRLCVVGVFTNDRGEVLVGQRSDVKGAWQLPQGGVDPGESNLGAIFREMNEELGTNEFDVVRIASRQVRYQFPAEVVSGAAARYAGQTLQWWLLKFKSGAGPQLEKADGEFSSFAWITPKKVVDGIVEWKKQAYKDGFEQLGLEI